MVEVFGESSQSGFSLVDHHFADKKRVSFQSMGCTNRDSTLSRFGFFSGGGRFVVDPDWSLEAGFFRFAYL